MKENMNIMSRNMEDIEKKEKLEIKSTLLEIKNYYMA